jgi:hypothetical protein
MPKKRRPPVPPTPLTPLERLLAQAKTMRADADRRRAALKDTRKES